MFFWGIQCPSLSQSKQEMFTNAHANNKLECLNLTSAYSLVYYFQTRRADYLLLYQNYQPSLPSRFSIHVGSSEAHKH
jgi:hypothetical protein